VSADLYRRERRRLRADAVLIARRVDRETRRRIWRVVRLVGFTSLSRAVRSQPDEVREQVFPGWPLWLSVAAYGRFQRQERRRVNRRKQRDRMAAHQARARAADLTLVASLRASLDARGER
jgi:hypothetical protein